MVENRIVAQAFDLDAFTKLLAAAAGDENAPVVAQVSYLARYCKRLGARTVVSEAHYIDRHFLDEHGLYYGRRLQAPPNHVRRFHLFSRAFNDADLDGFLEESAADEKSARAIEHDLSREYLGFISIRPVPAVPIGRTVLRRLEDDDQRDISATGAHEVHLANLTLTVRGLAFQQQDVAVGSCATAAAWSALSRVTRQEGMRAPTPAEVSQAAGRHLLPNGRVLPAVAGLSIEQLCEAIRSSGFAPEVVRAHQRPELFTVALHTYLRSGIPVVLILLRDDAQHAVTAVGFQLAAAAHPLLQTSVPVRSARIRKIYVHDDCLGPYARSFLRPLPRTEQFDEALLLGIERERDDAGGFSSPELGEPPDKSPSSVEPTDLEEWLVDSAIAPVYPKLRLPARSLVTLAEILGDPIEHMVGSENALKLGVEFYYARSGTYLSTLSGRIGPGSANFMRKVALSRWCGIVRWVMDEKPLVEFVYDTTDILRDGKGFGAELLLAVVCLDETFRKKVRELADIFFALSV